MGKIVKRLNFYKDVEFPLYCRKKMMKKVPAERENSQIFVTKMLISNFTLISFKFKFHCYFYNEDVEIYPSAKCLKAVL